MIKKINEHLIFNFKYFAMRRLCRVEKCCVNSFAKKYFEAIVMERSLSMCMQHRQYELINGFPMRTGNIC